MPTSSVRVATVADRPVLERLWLMFRHDLSEFRGLLPEPDGTFRSERLQASYEDPDWVSYLVVRGDRPVGLALVRGLTGATRVLSGFFVVRGVRRRGVGAGAAHELIRANPGPWEVACQDENPGAVAFWRRVASEVAGDGGWTEQRRPVPGRPDLPYDTWIGFRVDGPGRGREQQS